MSAVRYSGQRLGGLLGGAALDVEVLVRTCEWRAIDLVPAGVRLELGALGALGDPAPAVVGIEGEVRKDAVPADGAAGRGHRATLGSATDRVAVVRIGLAELSAVIPGCRATAPPIAPPRPAATKPPRIVQNDAQSVLVSAERRHHR